MKTYKKLFLSAMLILGLGCVRNQTIPPSVSPGQDKATQAVFPHPGNWVTAHGAQYLSNSAVCISCHGAKLDGGSTGVSCKMCHESYPHTAAWARPENHGATFSKILDGINKDGGDVQVNECVTCHKAPDANVTPGLHSAKNILCNSCHVGVPHSLMIPARDGQLVHHKEFGHEKVLQAACLSCHRPQADATQKYMPNLQKCTTCHYQPDVHPRIKWMSEDEAAKVEALLDQLRKK